MLRTALVALGLALAVPAGAQSYGERTALPRGDCDRQCLESSMTAYVAALCARDPSRAPFADTIRFTENSVEMPIGEGLWATVTSVNPADGMIAADIETIAKGVFRLRSIYGRIRDARSKDRPAASGGT